MSPAGAAPTVADVGELGLLARLQPWLAADGGALVAGAGDDAAVWQPPAGKAVVVTTDSLVEDAHFRLPLDARTAADLGWRLLAISLSDLAAMGASAGPAFVSLALPGAWPVDWVEAMYRGLAECAARASSPLAGGNISAATTGVLTSTCVGAVDPGAVLRRGGSEGGWELALTGPVGAAAARLRAGEAAPGWERAARPAPRLEAGAALAATGVRVAIDVSDGLFVDAARLLAGSRCPGLVVDAAAVPVVAGLRDRWPDDWLEVAAGGEDYELLFAAPPAVMAAAVAALAKLGLEPAVVGAFDGGSGLRVRREGLETAPPRAGHEHFRA